MADSVALRGSLHSAAALVDDAAWAAASCYGAAPHTAVEETVRRRWLITGASYEGLNGVYWARDGEAVDEALAPFRQVEVPMLWHAGPTSPDTLPRELADAGLSHYGTEPGMVLDLDQPANEGADSLDASRPGLGTFARWLPPEGLEIRRVGAEGQMRAWVRIWAAPPSRLLEDRLVALRAPMAYGVAARTPHLLGVLDGEPVACAAVWVGRLPGQEGRPVAWLEHIATRIAVRRRGIGTALTRACLDVARRRAASHAALTASPSAERLYRGLGFHDVCTVTRYLWSPR
ncbi:MAG: GNAT family N-acetyltransferase [Micromonosporaceae bacterium]